MHFVFPRVKDFPIIFSLSILLNHLDRPSQERSELWVKTTWMPRSISASVTPDFRRKGDKVHCFLCCTYEDEGRADGNCPWSISDTARVIKLLFFFAKNDIESDFLEISLSLCFSPFEILEISDIWWHSWQYAVRN